MLEQPVRFTGNKTRGAGRKLVDASANPGIRIVSAGTVTGKFRIIEAFGDVVITTAESDLHTNAELTGFALNDTRELHGLFTSITFTGGKLVCYT